MLCIVLKKSIGFSSVNVRFPRSLSSKNFCLNFELNHFTKVSIVNFSSNTKNSDNDVVFSFHKTLKAPESLICFTVIGSKN